MSEFRAGFDAYRALDPEGSVADEDSASFGDLTNFAYLSRAFGPENVGHAAMEMRSFEQEELEHAVSDAKAAAEKLRAEGKEEEAAKMEAMVVKLEGAQQAHEEAKELKKEAELHKMQSSLSSSLTLLMKAEGEAAEQAAEAAKAAGECAEALEKAGLGEEAKSVMDWQGMLEGDDEAFYISW